jgi:hypothetical protein
LNILRLSAIATVIGLGTFLGVQFRREHRKGSAPTHGTEEKRS